MSGCFSRLPRRGGFVSIVEAAQGRHGEPPWRASPSSTTTGKSARCSSTTSAAPATRCVAAEHAPALEALLAAGEIPDLFVLDIGLPGQSGLELARDLRARYDPGIVILTGAGDLVDRVVGLEIGADDYIGKPVELAELAARIAAVLRRRPVGGPPPPPARASAPTASTCAPSACATPPATPSTSARWRSTSSPPSPPTPAASSPATTSSASPRPRDDESNDRSIDHRVTRLRRKLEADPEHPQLIKTVRGVGYVHAG